MEKSNSIFDLSDDDLREKLLLGLNEYLTDCHVYIGSLLLGDSIVLQVNIEREKQAEGV
jgi:hypothetical protein